VAAARLRLPLRGLAALLRRWHRRAVTREALREMPRERLRDIGMSEADARHEASLPFWK
jgi:uncharacterized protein YjiS (DUF1127 family)